MNLIAKLSAVHKMCEAYGATLAFRNAKLPVRIYVPFAGAQSGEVVRCFADELLNNLGIMADIDNLTITFILE